MADAHDAEHPRLGGREGSAAIDREEDALQASVAEFTADVVAAADEFRLALGQVPDGGTQP